MSRALLRVISRTTASTTERALEENFAARYNTGPRGGVAVGQGARCVF